MTISHELPQLGWNQFFQQQLTLEEWDCLSIGRVAVQERSVVSVLSQNGQCSLDLLPDFPAITVGDWVLYDHNGRLQRRLDRSSLVSRKAAGTKVSTQLIAANIDTVFIVSSLNQDFNLNRLERYLVLANDALAQAVVVLTKLDQCDDPDTYCQSAQALRSSLPVLAVNSLDRESVEGLSPWCQPGNTVALLGSSGVGKSTLINTLLGGAIQQTKAVREDDAKGRHTTTNRSLHLLPSGGLLIDMPGMRELQLADCEHGIEQTFPEISRLSQLCKFSDCQHVAEPGCAVQEAIESGELDRRRLESYVKLNKEQAYNTATLSEKRQRDRDLGKYYRQVLAAKTRNQS